MRFKFVAYRVTSTDRLGRVVEDHEKWTLFGIVGARCVSFWSLQARERRLLTWPELDSQMTLTSSHD